MNAKAPLVFLEPAAEEFREAIKWYNAQEPGLGYEFAQEVRKCILRIRENIEAWPAISARTRRCRTNRFPYGLVYSGSREGIIVIAVMHLRRRPGYWKTRNFDF
jgi:hypothetical protein